MAYDGVPMSAHRLLVISRRFRGPPTSGNGGYTCGMLAAVASKPVEVRLVQPPPLDTPLEIVDEPETGGLRLVHGSDTIAIATPKTFELEVPRPPPYATALAAVGNYEGFQEHAYSDCIVRLHFFECDLAGEPAARLGQEMRWVSREELKSLEFPEADRELIELLTAV